LVGEENKRLSDYISEIRTLRGILPICSHCKRIKDAQAHWQKIEKYIHDRSEAKFSHGICPECEKAVWGDYLDGDK